MRQGYCQLRSSCDIMKDMREPKEAFKSTLKILKQSKKDNRRTFKADRLIQVLAQKRRFNSGDVFYGKQSLRFINCAYMNPSHTLHASAVLNSSIDAVLLENALFDAAAALPSLRLNVRKGFFTPYLQSGGYIPYLSAPGEIAREFIGDKTAYDFRVSFFKHRITVELSGYLGDFYTLNRFISCLTARYIQLSEHSEVSSTCHYLDRPSLSRLSDPFKEVNRTKYVADKTACTKLKGDEDIGITNLTSFETDRSMLQSAAGSDVNAYLIKLWGQAVRKAKGGNVCVGYYRSGREFYKTQTMRSFSVFVPVSPEFETRQDKREFDEAAAYNLRAQKKRVRYTPMPIKNALYRRKKRFTALYADAGEMEIFGACSVIRYEGGIMAAEPLSLTKADYKNKTVLTILSKFSDSDVEYEFYRLLPPSLNAVVGTNRRNNIV